MVNGYRIIASMPIAIVGLLSVGCYSPMPEDLPRAAVSGTVLLDGKPLDGIEIVFESDPVPPSNRIRAVYATIREGHYVIDAADGPAVGKAMVRLLDIPESREQMEAELNERNKDPRRRLHPQSYPVPEKFAAGSTLQVLIEPEVMNEHDFDLKTR